MKLNYLKALAPMAMAMALTGCFDDNYDLSDIDTTVQVKIDNLVIPVNIDVITMNSIIKPDDKIQVINGAYTYVQNGTFHSNDITIDPFRVNVPAINPASITLKPSIPVAVAIPITYQISNAVNSSVNFDASGIPTEIKEVRGVGSDIDLSLSISFGALKEIINKIDLNGLVIEIPKGLIIESNQQGTFDPATSTFKVNDVTVTANGSEFAYTLSLKATGVHFDNNVLDNGAIHYSGNAGIVAGEFGIKSDYYVSLVALMPSEINLSVDFKVGNFNVDYLEGAIEYQIKDLNIPDVDINDLPDVLTGEGTNLRLANPILYLNLTDPLYSQNLTAQTGLQIESYKDGKAVGTYTMDKPLTIGSELGHYQGNEFNFYLSPSQVSEGMLDPQYPKAAHWQFSTLGNVLEGDGMPTKLVVNALNPCIPYQTVDKFYLGQNMGKVEGKYKFEAPLQLQEGSVVIYNDTMDGWSSEDLDNATITSLEVNLNVTTDIPVGVDFTGYPIDTDGKRISGVQITGAKVPGNANNHALSIVVSGEIKHLDGIEFEAKATAVAGNALSPDMTIKLSNIRPKVSGYYEKEL